MLAVKTISVFYDNEGYPFKDAQRTVRYPITSGTFVGSHNTKQIRFYVRDIGGTDNITWVVLSKLPNGKLGYEICSNVVYDSEVSEYYLLFDLSAYYTSVKGDLYLSLRGYQGEVTFEDNDSDGVYNIVGDPLIEVTGTIKLAINYSPMVNTGTQVLPTDIDRLILALNNYIQKGMGIVVLANTSADVSGYNNNQMFFVVDEDNFYIKKNNALVKYDLRVVEIRPDELGVALPEEKLNILRQDNSVVKLVRTFEDEDTAYEYLTKTLFDIDSNTMQFTSRLIYDSELLRLYNIALTLNNTTGIATTSIATKLQLDTIPTEDSDNAITSGGVYSYVDSAITTEDSAVKTWANSRFLQRYPYSDYQINGTTTLVGLFVITGGQPSVIQFGSSSGKWFLCRVYNQYANYYGFEFECISNGERYTDVGIGGALGTAQLSAILNTNSNYYKPYATVEYVDSAIQDFLQNEYTKVDTTTYPTLNDFLASTGEEGYIYLYPINVNDESQGYYQYIWENNAWVSLGSTNIDLSDYVQKTTSANKVYGTNDQGEQTAYTVDDFYEGNIARRDSDNSITVPLTPTQNSHASSKKYVDDSFVFATNSEIDALFE